MNLAQATTNIGRGVYRKSKTTASRSKGIYKPTEADFIKSFYAILRRWRSETVFLSDPDQITAHASYLALVANARSVTDLIIADLRTRPSLLVWVLDDAYGERPYDRASVGNIPAMTDAWITWAERNDISVPN